jgi:4-amino-4-deoxy-L-arabinose transferase-like glycosyltransferase
MIAALTTAAAGGASAALLVYTAKRLGLSLWMGVAAAVLLAMNPMILMFSSNGMSEGIAAPFLIGATCFVLLYWRLRQRRFVLGAGISLGLAFATLYEAAPFGAALFAALVLGVIVDARRDRESSPRGVPNAIFALGALLVLPAIYVGLVWMVANALIMGDPLYFATSEDSNAGQTSKYLEQFGNDGGAFKVAGNFFETITYVGVRAWPFLIPAAAILLVRLIQGRFWNLRTLAFVLLVGAVPFGLITPLIYAGSSFGWLRFFMYPLFVAAAWGLYELAQSDRRRSAFAIISVGWLLCVPATYWAMTQPKIGQEEHTKVAALLGTAKAPPGDDLVGAEKPVAKFVEQELRRRGGRVLVGQFAAWSVRQNVSPDMSGRFLTTYDRRFDAAVKNPARYGVSMILLFDPNNVSKDVILRARPDLWAGAKDTTLIRWFKPTATLPDQWRLYAVDRKSAD